MGALSKYSVWWTSAAKSTERKGFGVCVQVGTGTLRIRTKEQWN